MPEGGNSGDDHRCSSNRRHREKLQKSSTSSGSTEKLVATRRKLRRMRIALRRLEQLSAAMEKHYQTMLQELGQWVVHLAREVQAPVGMLSLNFPDVPSHVGNWFLQVCSTARWVWSHLHQSHTSLPSLEVMYDSKAVPSIINNDSKKNFERSDMTQGIVAENIEDETSRKCSTLIEGASCSLVSEKISEASVYEIPEKKTQNISELRLSKQINISESSSSGSQNKNKYSQVKSTTASNGSDKQISDRYFKTFPTVKESHISKKGYYSMSGTMASSEDLSMSVGSLDSVFGFPELSVTVNAQPTNINGKTGSEKDSTIPTNRKGAEDKLIAILDGLKDKLLNVDTIDPAENKVT